MVSATAVASEPIEQEAAGTAPPPVDGGPEVAALGDEDAEQHQADRALHPIEAAGEVQHGGHDEQRTRDGRGLPLAAAQAPPQRELGQPAQCEQGGGQLRDHEGREVAEQDQLPLRRRDDGGDEVEDSSRGDGDGQPPAEPRHAGGRREAEFSRRLAGLHRARESADRVGEPGTRARAGRRSAHRAASVRRAPPEPRIDLGRRPEEPGGPADRSAPPPRPSREHSVGARRRRGVQDAPPRRAHDQGRTPGAGAGVGGVSWWCWPPPWVRR